MSIQKPSTDGSTMAASRTRAIGVRLRRRSRSMRPFYGPNCWTTIAFELQVRPRCGGCIRIAGAVPADLWRRLVDTAKQHFDMLVYSGLFLVDNHPDLPLTLATRAEAGLRARLLYGNPDSEIVAWRGEEEGIGEDLAARIRLSLKYMAPARGVDGVEVRQHQTVLYNSVYRFDDEMLVNTHVIGSPAPQNPVLHLQRVPGGHLFDHYLRSFDRVWDLATPLDHPRQS